MTTTVVKTIGTASRDYATIAPYATYVDAVDLGATDTIQEGDLYNDGEFAVAGAVGTFSNATVLAADYIKLIPAAGQGFYDNPNVRNNALSYNQTNGVGLNDTATGGSSTCLSFTSTPFTRITGLQLKSTDGRALSINSANVTVSNCIIYGVNSFILELGATVTSAVFNNCLLKADQTGGNALMGDDATTVSATFNFCTIIGLGDYYVNNSGTETYVNCAFFGGGTTAFNFNGSPVSQTFDHCMTNITGTTGLTGGKIFGAQFVNTTNDFRVKAGADLINAGTPVGGITTDISGFARNASTPTIGCWEFAPSIGTTTYHW